MDNPKRFDAPPGMQGPFCCLVNRFDACSKLARLETILESQACFNPRFGFRPTNSKFVLPLFFISLSLVSSLIAAESVNEDLLTRAKAAYAGGNVAAAIARATKAIEANHRMCARISFARNFMSTVSTAANCQRP